MKKKWFKLENAAKIFPPTSTKKDPKVFRFVSVLKEKVDGDILQEAAKEALDLFPNFQSVLKKGFFWYYLETTDYNPIIKEDKRPLCRPIYPAKKKKLLFRVNYYQNKINVEIYHVLTDGTGAMEFLKTIVYIYLQKVHHFENHLESLDYDASIYERSDDSFSKYYEHTSMPGEAPYPPYILKGEKASDQRFRVITGKMSTKELLSLAHTYHTTMTGLLVGLWIWSIRKNMSYKDRKKCIYIDVPVNLRKYFPSQTARNFFCVLKVGYNLESDELEDIIAYTHEYIQRELKQENLKKRMNRFATMEHNYLVRLIPLFLKNLILKIATVFTTRNITASVSNLGKITVPKEIQEYIDSFEVFVSTEKVQICLCSYLDTTSISFSSVFVSTDSIKTFYRFLTDANIKVTISANKIEE